MFEDKDLNYLLAYKDGMRVGVDIALECMKKAIQGIEEDLKLRFSPDQEIKQ